VDGAGPDHDEETVIALGYDFDDVFAALVDGLLCVGRDGELGGEERWGDQGIVSEDCEEHCQPVKKVEEQEENLPRTSSLAESIEGIAGVEVGDGEGMVGRGVGFPL
jgi:hypothetical protein